MPFLCEIISFLLFLNAGQSQSGTIFDVILKWFPLWIIAKIGLNNTIQQTDTWEEAIHRWTDWNGFALKIETLNLY
jgi:hypothetical protein